MSRSRRSKASSERFIKVSILKEEITRDVTDEDVERLLKIPIRRISQFDIQRMEDEIRQLQDRLAEVEYHLKHLTEYALDFLKGVLDKHRDIYPRRNEIVSLRKVDVRDAARKNLKLKYNPETGYLGYEVSGGRVLFDASVYDRVLCMKKDGTYFVTDIPDKPFVDKGRGRRRGGIKRVRGLQWKYGESAPT